MEPRHVATGMLVAFEAGLPQRVDRASRVNLQNLIPQHWFSAAASECARMYVEGFYYGAISVAQAYAEAVSKFLVAHHGLRNSPSSRVRWNRLRECNIVSSDAVESARRLSADRNDFHHLNREVEQDYRRLEERALECVNLLHAIESEVFAFTYGPSGGIQLERPEYWPGGSRDSLVSVHIRNLW